jgi:hypothetical protein
MPLRRKRPCERTCGVQQRPGPTHRLHCTPQRWPPASPARAAFCAWTVENAWRCGALRWAAPSSAGGAAGAALLQLVDEPPSSEVQQRVPFASALCQDGRAPLSGQHTKSQLLQRVAHVRSDARVVLWLDRVGGHARFERQARQQVADRVARRQVACCVDNPHEALAYCEAERPARRAVDGASGSRMGPKRAVRAPNAGGERG